VAVPREALLKMGNDTVLFVEQRREADGRIVFGRRKVTASEQIPGDVVPVLEGISAGERVATRGAIFLLGN
jgi:hypothetical protein